MIQRRLYVYIVSAASLGMLLVGLSNLGSTALTQVTGSGGPGFSPRDAYAGFGAVTLVGLPVWAIHWLIAQRLAGRRSDERASALRRLYLYAVLATVGIVAAIFLRRLLQLMLADLGGGRADDGMLFGSFWISAILLACWFYHLQLAARDRQAVGEEGASATLRRWETYTLLSLGLGLLLFGLRDLVQQLWVLVVGSQGMISAGTDEAASLSTTLVGLAFFALQTRLTATLLVAEDDRRSTLRAVQGFLALLISVVMALVGASQLLYYVLDRLLGVPHPGGVQDSLLVALGGPGATALVFGFAWIWLRARVSADVRAEEVARQVSVRRLYTHLVALVAMATLAVGAAGLLWTLSDQVLRPLTGVAAGEWRDRTSLFLTLVVVSTPMWLTHWRPRVPALERHSLSRRLYLYAALLASVLALLISAAVLISRLLNIVLATAGSSSGAAIVDLGRAASVMLVAVGLGVYHWQVLREDGRVPSPAPVAEPDHEHFSIDVTGVSEGELRRVLTGLPRGANYSITRREA